MDRLLCSWLTMALSIIMTYALSAQEAIFTMHDAKQLQDIKTSLKAASENRQLFTLLLIEADACLQRGPYSVTSKNAIPPSGDKKDYLSLGPYWWPDKSKKTGLPWVNRDGEINPSTRGKHVDIDTKSDFLNDVEVLTWAYYFSDSQEYARHLKFLLRTWLLDESTAMNPNLNYAQGIPGLSQGRGIGIIEWVGITRVITALEVLEAKNTLDENEVLLYDKWLGQLFDWIANSPYGKEECNKENNHGTWYDVIYVSLASHLGYREKASNHLEKITKSRVSNQIIADGRQPHELKRTKSLSYSVMNLRAFLKLCDLGRDLEVDLWNYEGEKDASIPLAINYLLPYQNPEKVWPYPQINKRVEAEKQFDQLVLKAKNRYDFDVTGYEEYLEKPNSLRGLISIK